MYIFFIFDGVHIKIMRRLQVIKFANKAEWIASITATTYMTSMLLRVCICCIIYAVIHLEFAVYYFETVKISLPFLKKFIPHCRTCSHKNM